MRSVEPRQLSFVFVDSPQGGGDLSDSGEPEGEKFLLHTAKTRKANDSTAAASGGTRLLEKVASPANLATALLHVARNKGAPGWDGQTVDEVVGVARHLLPLASIHSDRDAAVAAMSPRDESGERASAGVRGGGPAVAATTLDVRGGHFEALGRGSAHAAVSGRFVLVS